MRKNGKQNPGSDLTDHVYWAKLGADDGRRNEPRTPDGDAPVRSRLRHVYESTLNAEHISVRGVLDAVTVRWHEVRRTLHDAHAQATAGDARAQSNVSMLLKKQEQLGDEWDKHCDEYLGLVRVITNDANEVDGVWRTANGNSRDRRIVVRPTDLQPPAEVLDLPDRPY